MKDERLLATWDRVWNLIGEANRHSLCPFRFPDIKKAADHFRLPSIAMPAGVPVETLSLPDGRPTMKNLTDAVLAMLQHKLATNPDNGEILYWADGLHRSIEIGRHDLRNRFAVAKYEDIPLVRRRALWTCLFFLECFNAYNDPRFVNVVLKILEQSWLKHDPLRANMPRAKDNAWIQCLGLLVHVLCEYVLYQISQPDYRKSRSFSADHCLQSEPEMSNCPVFDHGNQSHVVVFSPSPYSLYTLTCLELLERQGIQVAGIMIRRLFDRKRVVQELRRDGKRLITKIWKKFVLRKKAYHSRNYQTLPKYMQELGISSNSITEWAKERKTPVWWCKTLNDALVAEALLQIKPRLVVFTGGGLIRESILELSGQGVVNCHMGILPPYRGMDVVEWPILEGHSDRTGLTIHFMAKGLDEGDILAMYPAPRGETQDIVQLRECIEVLMPQAMVSTVARYLEGTFQPVPQRIRDGCQFFHMHPRLYSIAAERYRQWRQSEHRSGE